MIFQNPFYKSWGLAIRPKTLPAAASPVLVASAMAFADGYLNLGLAMVCMFVALLLQIGSNLANDVFDYEKGADSGERMGPTRVTQAGLLTAREVKRGMWVVFGITALLGSYLVFIGGWPFLIIGLAAIVSAIAYTGGPYPLGYHGFGDIFVFLFFGLAATAGTYFLQVGKIPISVWWMAAAQGFLTVAILVVNNLRDINIDRTVNKKTLAVRFGERGTRLQYFFLMIAAYLVPVILSVEGIVSSWSLLTLVSIPLGLYWAVYITRYTGKALNKALAGTGQLELIYGLLFMGGMILSVIPNYP
jgi:1,4-dihydroxy-2-naphthoate octaprenyltransferase